MGTVAKSPRDKNRVLLQCIQQLYTADSIKVALGIGNYVLGSYFLVVSQENHCSEFRIFKAQLTTPENSLTSHNALCLSPQNFA